MAWTYEQLFDGLNDGNLSGQDSWTDDTEWQVVTDAISYEGTKCIKNIVSNTRSTKRDITAVTSGTFYFSMRSGDTAIQAPWFDAYDSTTRLFLVRFELDELEILDSTGWVKIQDIVDDTWYRIGVEFDCSTDIFNISVDSSAFSGNYDFVSATTDLDNIVLFSTGATSPVYMDAISPDYTPSSANHYTLVVDTMALVFTYNAILLEAARKLVADTMALVFTFADVVLTRTFVGITLVIDTMALSFTYNAVLLKATRNLVADTMALVFTFNPINFLYVRALKLVVATMSLVLTFADVVLKVPGRWTNESKSSSTWTNLSKN